MMRRWTSGEARANVSRESRTNSSSEGYEIPDLECGFEWGRRHTGTQPDLPVTSAAALSFHGLSVQRASVLDLQNDENF